MQLSKNQVIKPLYEKLHTCPYCYARLSFIQYFEKNHNKQIICRKCGMAIKRDKNIMY